MHRKWLRLGLIGLLVIALAACGQQPAGPTVPTPQPGEPSDPTPTVVNEITIVTNGDGKIINPVLVVDLDGYWRTDHMFDALIRLDGDTLEPVPHLAKDWTISPDGLTYTFLLNELSTWHDGEPVTAYDLEFTVMTILSPDYTGAWQRRYAVLEGADEVIAGRANSLPGLRVIDEHTLEMKLTEPYAPFLAVTLKDFKPIPKHLLEGEEITADHDYSNAPIGNGPYKFHEWVKGQHFIMVANEDYWAGPPKMKKVTQLVIPDMNAIAMALEAGDADASIMPPPAAVPRLGQLDFLDAHRLPALSIEGFQFNLEHPIVGNPLVRQAIGHAINVLPFTEQILQGITTPATGHVVPALWAHNPNVNTPAYDPDKAKQLLVEAGYPDGFEITVRTNAGNIFREQFTTYAQAELAKVGIKVNIVMSEWGTFFALVQQKDYEMAFQSNLGGLPDPDMLFNAYHSKGPNNYFHYANPEVDRLLTEARLIADVETRRGMYYKVQEMLMEDLPFLPCFWRPNPLVVQSRFTGFHPSGLGAYWNIYDWEIKQ